jgi:hypothetical protein
MKTHTPGPWKAKVWQYPTATPPRNELNIESGTHLLATLQWADGQDNPYTIQDDEARANAALIAAAPDMLAILEKLTLHTLHYATMQHAHSSAHKDAADARAIIKAIGGTGA